MAHLVESTQQLKAYCKRLRNLFGRPPPLIPLLSLSLVGRETNPFVLGDSSKLHHDEELKEAQVPDRFEQVMCQLRDFSSGTERQRSDPSMIHVGPHFCSDRSHPSLHADLERPSRKQFCLGSVGYETLPVSFSSLDSTIGTFTPPESDVGLTVTDFTRTWDEVSEQAALCPQSDALTRMMSLV
jgi:hypothetical protein